MLLFPLPEPPADVVAELLDELRLARRELADARRIVHMLGVDFPGEGVSRLGEFRLTVETRVAGLREAYWRDEVARIEQTGRGLGLDVSSTS